MRGEPRDLLAVQVRHAQRVAVRRPPDRLHHVPEVEAAGHEGRWRRTESAAKPAAYAAIRGEDGAAIG